jgi:hypothetical protein
MADSTGIDRTTIDKAVTDLKALIPDSMITDFDAVDKLLYEAGPAGMDAATWLEDVVMDRRHGMLEHTKQLKFIFNGLGDALTAVANTLQNQDTTSAGNLESGALTSLNNWVTSVQNYKLPPAIPADHHINGKTTYETGDTATPESNYTSFDIGRDGYHVVDKDGNLVLNLAADPKHLPAGQFETDYQTIISEVNKKDGATQDISEDFIFVDGHPVLKPGDPEN